ncbi:MAG: carboxypeptidase regulatory-like domain-containing protein, partial [Desulfobacteraceae bacterium]
MFRRKIYISIGLILALGVLAVLLFKQPGSAQPRPDSIRGRTVYGRVISKYGPVENARVRVAGTERYTLTDRQGRFELSTGHFTGKKLWVTAGKEGWFNNAQVAYPSGRMKDIFLYPVY